MTYERNFSNKEYIYTFYILLKKNVQELLEMKESKFFYEKKSRVLNSIALLSSLCNNEALKLLAVLSDLIFNNNFNKSLHLINKIIKDS